jgi:hypothetical protein
MSDATQMSHAEQMSDATLNDVLPAIAERRVSRRRLLRRAATAAGVAVGSGLVGRSARADTVQQRYGPKGRKIKVKDVDILNFALNLEYLEAEFYQRAAYGFALGTTDVSGQVGTQGSVTGGGLVPFSDPIVQQYAEEIADEELAHVRFLRATLGVKDAVTRPTIDFTTGFSTLGAAAGIGGTVSSTGTFDPFADDLQFLLGAFFFEDLGVTAYQGAAPYIGNSTYLQKAAGILAVEGYHASAIRTTLYRGGAYSSGTYYVLDACNQLSAIRQTYSQAGDSISPTDEGISYAGPLPNIVPATATGLTYPRSFAAVLNVLYLNNFDILAQSGQGGFFPAGFNGRIR